ncbi:MAG: outer membrane protein transport protein [Candidatus Contendobacter sp.]|nr:outer membrane protein transport protein [Candidatus Contendobacter sp.]
MSFQRGLLFATSAVFSGSAVAGGLLLYEVGTADVGLASAGYTARAQDASTVLTNPAGMTRLPGKQLLLGAQVLYGDSSFSAGSGTSPELGRDDGGNPIGWFPGGGMFYTQQLSPTVTAGFAATGNFGLSESYDSNWVGRYYLQESTLLGLSLLPSIAWQVSPEFSLGASLNATYGIFRDQVAVNNVLPGAADGQLKLSDNVWGFGVNIGALYEPQPGTRIGLTYTSQVDLDFSANADFSRLAPGLELLLGQRGLLGSSIDLGMSIPQTLNLSFFQQMDQRWALLGSLGWQNWAQFGKVDVSVDSNDPKSLTTSLDFKDTWHAALGAQVKVSDPWTLNFGMAYDSGFQDNSNVTPALPANAAWRFGIGAQNQVNPGFEWGIAAEYIYGGSMDVNKLANSPAVGGRGDLIGSIDTDMFFLAANFIWKFQ